MTSLAFVYDDVKQNREAQLLRDVFSVGDFRIECVSWRDPFIRWERYEAVFIRQTPKTETDFSHFWFWLVGTSSLAQVFNSLEIIGWNRNKEYFLDYKRKGIPTLQTVTYCKDSKEIDISKYFKKGDVLAVLNESGNTAFTVGKNEGESMEYLKAVIERKGEVVVQEKLSKEEQQEEFIFVSINGRLSHALKKSMRGAYVSFRPDEASVQTADYVLRVSEDIWEEKDISPFASTPILGNFKFVARENGSVLTNVEFIQPQLFLWEHPHALAKFFNGFLSQRNGTNPSFM